MGMQFPIVPTEINPWSESLHQINPLRNFYNGNIYPSHSLSIIGAIYIIINGLRRCSKVKVL